jgi:hypothetical protein
MLESIKVVAAIEVPPRRQTRSANDDALRFARSCYDHLAGQVGVAVTDALVAMGPMKAVRSRLRAGVSFPRSALI